MLNWSMGFRPLIMNKEIDRTIFYNLKALGKAMLESAEISRGYQRAHEDKTSMRHDGVLKYDIYKSRADTLEAAGKILVDSAI